MRDGKHQYELAGEPVHDGEGETAQHESPCAEAMHGPALRPGCDQFDS
jgi:hypothetical protein